MEWYLNDEQYQMRMHAQGCTQSDMDDADRVVYVKKIHVAFSNERTHYKNQYKVVQPYQNGGSDTET